MTASSEGRERRLYRLQADLCQMLADPTRLEILYALSTGPRAVKDLVEATGQRQAKVSQHLAIMRQRDIVRARRVGAEVHYSLGDSRILEACHVTRALLLDQLASQSALAGVSLESERQPATYVKAETPAGEQDEH